MMEAILTAVVLFIAVFGIMGLLLALAVILIILGEEDEE